MVNNALITLYAITSLHPGTGQSTGIVDLPVQREKHTGFPMIASSGLKGSLRDKAERAWGRDDGAVTTIFGSPEAGGSDSSAGALIVSDARILAFPVRSLQKVFVWVTCPMVLRRLRRDLALAGLEDVPVPEVGEVERGGAILPEGFTSPLVLEEIRLDQADADRQPMGLSHICPEVEDDRLVIVSDGDFQHFVRHATQVSARIKLNERKTTTDDGGNLWYEETLPPETIMYALLMAQNPRRDGSGLSDAHAVLTKARELFRDNAYLQVGGNETVGQGWCSVAWHGGGQ